MDEPQFTSEPIELPLVLLSHRGPVTFGREHGRRTASKGSGGLVTARLGLRERLADAGGVCCRRRRGGPGPAGPGTDALLRPGPLRPPAGAGPLRALLDTLSR